MKKRVLVLEDQGGILFGLAERLKHENYEVCLAGDLYTATQGLDDFNPDAIIVDLNMDPAGLKPELISDTVEGQLTGWIWLRQYPEYFSKAIIYSAYSPTLVAHTKDSDPVRKIIQIDKRQEGHVQKVVDAVDSICENGGNNA